MAGNNRSKVIECVYWLAGIACLAFLLGQSEPGRGLAGYGLLGCLFAWGVLGRVWALSALKSATREMGQRSMIDEGTGALSRARLFDALSREVKSAKRKHDKLSIILVEAMNIIEINQKFDRSEGDACLAAVAMASQACLRETDYLGRSTGLVFCAILPGAGQDSAVAVRGRMVGKIQDIARSHPKGEVHVKFRTALCQWDDQEGDLPLMARAEDLLAAESIIESTGHGSD